MGDIGEYVGEIVGLYDEHEMVISNVPYVPGRADKVKSTSSPLNKLGILTFLFVVVMSV